MKHLYERWFDRLEMHTEFGQLGSQEATLWGLRIYTLHQLLRNQTLYRRFGLDIPEPAANGFDFRQMQIIARDIAHANGFVDFFDTARGEPLSRASRYAFQDLWHWLETTAQTLEELEREGAAMFAAALKRLTDRRHGSFATTLAPTAKLIAHSVCESNTSSVYDPACGVGNLLVACGQRLRALGVEQPQLFGQEISQQELQLCTMHLLLLGFTRFKLSLGDTLTDPKFVRDGALERFDVVVNNPPFGRDRTDRRAHVLWNDSYNRFFEVRSAKLDLEWLFLQHGLGSVQPDGRLAILMNAGTMTRSGAERELRRALLERGLVETVVALPAESWLSSSAIGGYLVILNPALERRNRHLVYMVNVADLTPAKGRTREVEAAFVAAGLEAIRESGERAGRSALVPFEAIAAREYNLQPQAYVVEASAKTAPDLEVLRLQSAQVNLEVQAAQSAFETALNRLRRLQTDKV